MASTTKIQNPRVGAPPPRLVPRPTAASAARAARNASCRNQPVTPTKPPKSPVRPNVSRTKASITTRSSIIPKTESKLELKPSPKPDPAADGRDEIVPNPSDSERPASATFPIRNSNIEINQNQEELCLNEGGSVNEQPADADGSLCESVENNSEIPVATEELAEEPSPKCTSCPQTPQSKQSSRPPTPRSRPVTPSSQLEQPSSRPNSGPDSRFSSRPSSRPTTPKTPTFIHAAQRAQPRSRIPGPSIRQQKSKEHEEEVPPPEPRQEYADLQTEYTAKQNQFHHLKKELDLKQHALMQLFDSLRSLSERMSQDGNDACGETLPVQDLVVVNVGDWTAHELARLCKEALASTDAHNAIEIIKNTSGEIDEEYDLDEKGDILNLPSQFAELCLQAFTTRQELIDWLKELSAETGKVEHLDRIAQYNNQGIQLCETLRVLKTQADEVINTVTCTSRRACKERSALMSVGESLVREIARLRQDLEAQQIIVNEIQETRVENKTCKSLEDAHRALEEERANSRATKEKLNETEVQLRQTRARITKMDRQLREAETTITSLTVSVKSLEEESHQREKQFESRAKKLKESLKTDEVTNSQLLQQRTELQAQIQSLKEQIIQLTEQNKSASEQMKHVKELRDVIIQKEQETEKERELRIQMENELQEREVLIEKLKTKIDHDITRPSAELPTDREMDLWAELQATKDSLRMAEEEMTACKREKARFLETLTKISESENKFGIQQKLAAELLSKEEIINKMQTQIRDLTKNVRLNEQKMIQYEQYVRDLQEQTRVVADCMEAPNGISYQDLQQEIMTLRMKLLDAEHRNSDLADVLAQKELQLEQQDKTSRAQARVIKVREELINMLKNKESEQSRELSALQQDCEQRMKIVDDVNKQIAAKADEIQELFATLETKQQQIHRLEKIVLALEEQQRRAQAQRTRHEEKIAALEHELAAGGRKDRKFLFF